MDDKEYMADVESGLLERAVRPETEADKAARDRFDISEPVSQVDDVEFEEGDETPVPEAAQSAIEQAMQWGFSPDEAKVLALNGLVTRIGTMREGLSSPGKEAGKADAKEHSRGDGTTADPDTGGTGTADGDLATMVKSLQRELAEVKAHVGRVPDAIDDHIIASGHGSTFGDGRFVDPDSAHADNRRAVREHVETLRAGMKAQGKAVPPDAELVRRAIAMQFGSLPKDARSAAIAKRQSNFTARASAVREPEMPEGPERAYASVGAKLRSYKK